MRPFRESDLDAFHAMRSSEPVRRSLHTAEIPTREQSWSMMAQMLGHWELRYIGQWVLEEQGTGRFLGRAGAYRPEREDWPGIEIGWTLDPSAWGNGYAPEAGRAAVDWVFANHDAARLYSMILADNTLSQAVARRVGFEKEGERVYAWFPALPHAAWTLTRQRWGEVRVAQAET